MNYSKYCGHRMTTAHLHKKTGGLNRSASTSLDNEVSEELCTQETDQQQIII